MLFEVVLLDSLILARVSETTMENNHNEKGVGKEIWNGKNKQYHDDKYDVEWQGFHKGQSTQLACFQIFH